MLVYYIFKEFIFPFCLAFFAIASLLLIMQIYRFLPALKSIDSPWIILLSAIPYMMPPIMRPLLLICSPIAVYLGVNRLANDSEIIALQAAGGSIRIPLLASLLFSFFIVLLFFVQTFYLVPISRNKMHHLENSLLQSAKIKFNTKQVNNLFQSHMIYIQNSKDNLLENVIIANWKNPFSFPIIQAKEGRLIKNIQTNNFLLSLHKGNLYQYSKNPIEFTWFDFVDLTYQLPLTTSNISRKQEIITNTHYATLTDFIRLIFYTDPKPKKFFYYIITVASKFVSAFSLFFLGCYASLLGIIKPRSGKTGNLLALIAHLWIFLFLYTILNNYLDTLPQNTNKFYALLPLLALLPSIGSTILRYIFIVKNTSSIELVSRIFKKRHSLY